MRRVGLIVVALIFSVPSAAQTRLAAPFGDHMVLQQGRRLPLFGHDAPGTEIEVATTWTARRFRGRADASGRFTVQIETAAAGGPFEITVRGTQTLLLRDVLLGEVWICSGQSNMEWSLAACDETLGADAEGGRDRAEFERPGIRLLTVRNRAKALPADDVEGEWLRATTAHAAGFSAVGWYFGAKLRDELRVPIGLIASDWGGTRVEAWTPADRLLGFASCADDLAEIEAERRDPGRIERAVRAADEECFDAALAKEGGIERAGLGFDDSAWEPASMPALWESHGHPDFDGAMWLRRRFRVTADQAARGARLHLGPLDDFDRTWVNGRLVGVTEDGDGWNVPRNYEIPTGVLAAGENVVCVRIVDSGGSGGMTGSEDDCRVTFDGDPPATIALGGAGWRQQRGLAWRDFPEKRAVFRVRANTASALWNGMMAPLARCSVAGFLFYQGESNHEDAAGYEKSFPNMINAWREEFGSADLPFYFVQIAPFRYGSRAEASAELRDAQRKTLSLPHTGMACTLDVGDPDDIHPLNKRPVGERLARWALHDTYARAEVLPSGPLVRSAVADGADVRIAFEYGGAGLTARELTQFEVAGEDGVYHRAQGRIENGDSLVIRSDGVKSPKRVRYAFTHAPHAELFNSEGLPASSFEVEVRTGGRL